MKYTKKKIKKQLKKSLKVFATMLVLALVMRFYSSDAKNALSPQESIVMCLYFLEHYVCNEKNGFYKQDVILMIPIFGSSKELQIRVMIKKRSSKE